MSLEFVDIAHAYGAAPAVTDIDLTAAPGEITCLLGPSGCGKTTLLQLAAGLLDVQHGEIRLDGKTIADAKRSPPPEARDIGLVFQEGALFPHMTVAQNIAFALHRDVDQDAIVKSVLQQLRLDGYADRYPHTLSGGQQQRVALGRAVAPAPRALLLDEPFANADVVLRRALREETRRVLKARGAVAILVTHDPDEAMDVADQIAIMDNGRLIQTGSPADVFDAPTSATAAKLFGDAQLLTGRKSEGGVATPFGDWPASAFHGALPDAANLDVLARPETLALSRADTNDSARAAKIEDIRVAGPALRLLAAAPSGETLWASAPRNTAFAIGDIVVVTPKEGGVFAFPASK